MAAAAGAPDPDDKTKKKEQEENNETYYRGGDKLKARANVDVKVDSNGMVQPGKGVSLNTDPTKLSNFGNVNKIDTSTISKDLEIVARGKPGHFEIAPRTPMSFEHYQSLLDQIKFN